MEPLPPERPEVELLEPDPPGSLERFATAVWQRRGTRIATAVAVTVAAGVGVTAALAGTSPEPAAPAAADERSATEARTSDDRVPPPWVRSGERGWQVIGRFALNPRSPVYVVTFRAANRTGEAQSPDRLRVVGDFVGRPGFRFSATCTGFHRNQSGQLRPVRSTVGPGERIHVRCKDAMEYSGNRPRLLRGSLEAETTYCEETGRGPEVF